jgi:hypothetical protein
MKKWIGRCLAIDDHGPPEHDFKPARLIKVAKSKDDRTRLCSPTSPVHFAALSYRWGADSEARTLRDNPDERFGHLETSSLLKTLKDAMEITRGLNLEYIWIDRICIVQDDVDDWTEQASLIAKIYASAYVVLSAIAAKYCKDGFLNQ